jgi:hypothetical protein
MTADPSLFDELGHRQCTGCGEIKPLQEFPATRRTNGSLKVRSQCRPCRNAYQHEWYLAHRDGCLAAAATRRATAKALRVPEPPPARQPLPEAVGFRAHGNTRHQGDAGLGIAIAYFSRIGAKVGIPTHRQPAL